MSNYTIPTEKLDHILTHEEQRNLFDEYVAPLVQNWYRVELQREDLEKVQNFSRAKAAEKEKENLYQKDPHNIVKRARTGQLGEVAVEKLIQVAFVDYRIGKSSEFNTFDIPVYGIGVKAVEWGKFPLVQKKNSYPQIICVLGKATESGPVVVYVCGVATPTLLNTKSTEALVLDEDLRKRQAKVGFYGFAELSKLEGNIKLLVTKQVTEQ